MTLVWIHVHICIFAIVPSPLRYARRVKDSSFINSYQYYKLLSIIAHSHLFLTSDQLFLTAFVIRHTETFKFNQLQLAILALINFTINKLQPNDVKPCNFVNSNGINRAITFIHRHVLVYLN